MQQKKLFESALGLSPPWYVSWVRLDDDSQALTVGVDHAEGSRFGVEGLGGSYPVHDAVVRRHRHPNFFEHRCLLWVRTPRVRLPDGSLHRVRPPFAGRLPGFSLKYEATVLALAAHVPFEAVARSVGIAPHRVAAICRRYVARALESLPAPSVAAGRAMPAFRRGRRQEAAPTGAVADDSPSAVDRFVTFDNFLRTSEPAATAWPSILEVGAARDLDGLIARMVEALDGGEPEPGNAEAQRAVAVRAMLEQWSEAVIRCGPEQPPQEFGTHLDAIVAWH